ncbi:kinase-like protein, partial [Scenedesmus sp. NREL 46B-D3]
MTEYIRGGSLASFLRMSRSLVPLRTRCELALAASNGLAYLHELRIVHFDLKPDNLLLDAPPAVVRAAAGADLEEPAPVVKVADFGLSKHKLNSTYVSSCKDLRGTLPYMAPELVADPERVSEKADVWSLGVVMWEMLTRDIPFQALAPQQILLGLMCGNLQLDIPEWCEPEWRGILEACMEPNPSARPSMRELARHLEAIRDQQVAI